MIGEREKRDVAGTRAIQPTCSLGGTEVFGVAGRREESESVELRRSQGSTWLPAMKETS